MDFDLGKLMEQAQRLTRDLQDRQEDLGRREVEGRAGAGMVTAVMSGRGDLLRLHIDPKVFATGASDQTLVEDLIVAAVNAALAEVQTLQQRELTSLAGPLGAAGGASDLILAGAPAPLQRLVTELGRLPGIGEKTALRLAFHILRAEQGYARGLAQAIVSASEKVRLCSVCCTLTDADLCALCSDPRREGRVLCVVEGVQDLMAIERSREFQGRYHVLHGVLAPIEGIGPDQLRIKELLVRLNPGADSPAVQEVIVATNPDVEGEATALYLTRLLRPLGLRITRIAQGIPMGGDLEFADPATLARAIQARREL